MFKILPLLVLHVLSHLVAVLLLQACGGLMPVAHASVLEYMRVSAVLYYYRLAGKVAWAYMGVGVVRHWEVVAQQVVGWCLLLVQYPVAWLWVLLAGGGVVIVRFWGLVWLLRLEEAVNQGRRQRRAGVAQDVSDSRMQ